MNSEDDKPARVQRSDRHKAIAMTRQINMVSEEFIENFSQTGKDTGPETPAKLSPVREALTAREQREKLEQQKDSEKPAFSGFASLMANANRPGKSSAFARLLSDEPEPAEVQTPAQGSIPHFPGSRSGPSTEVTADGSIIKVKDTVGKKRGLYTSCMQRPSTEQLQEMAVKYARPGATEAPATAPSSSAPTSSSPFRPPSTSPSAPLSSPSAPLSSPASSPSPFSREAAASAAKAAAVAQPDQSSSLEPAPIVTPSSPARTWAKCESSNPIVPKAKMTYESTCPIACAFGKFGSLLQQFGGWCKSKIGS
jgi:hypothetical protein